MTTFRKILHKPAYHLADFYDETSQKSNICLARTSVNNKNVVSILSSIFVGSPFSNYITEDIRDSPVNRAVARAGYKHICISVAIKGGDPRIATRLFVGLHIVKFRKELSLLTQSIPLTFLDVVIIFLLACVESSHEIDILLNAVFTTAGVVGKLFDACTTIKTKAGFLRFAPEVTAILLRFSSWSQPTPSLAEWMKMPLLVKIDANHPMVECTHIELKQDILGTLSALDKKQLAYYLDPTPGAVTVGACDRLMLAVHTPATHDRVYRVRAIGDKFSRSKWTEVFADVPHHAPLLKDDKTPYTEMYVGIFDILTGKDEITAWELAMYSGEKLGFLEEPEEVGEEKKKKDKQFGAIGSENKRMRELMDMGKNTQEKCADTQGFIDCLINPEKFKQKFI